MKQGLVIVQPQELQTAIATEKGRSESIPAKAVAMHSWELQVGERNLTVLHYNPLSTALHSVWQDYCKLSDTLY